MNAEESQKDSLPAFESLPIAPGHPKGCAWGVFDRKGEKDQYGTLNLITADTIKGAATEIHAGISVSLNWSLDKPDTPVFGRKKIGHEIIDNSLFSTSLSLDDEISLNTQSGSQWDGLRHVIHRETGTFYNGVRKDDVIGPNATNILGINTWHTKGGIVGRGVLIDYVAYARRHNIRYSPIEYHAISLSQLQAAAKEQEVEFKRGDILIVRSGLIKWYNECTSKDERNAYFTRKDKAGVGVAPTDETVAWVWNQHFSAVAGDALAWEAIPYPDNAPSFHQYLLASWGTPIGELWDLEQLAKVCEELGRYSFFFTSISLNVPGGVASPPNALAIF